jgi:hypothetical protein
MTKVQQPEETGLISLMRRNCIYILMFLAIISVLFFKSFFIQEEEILVNSEKLENSHPLKIILIIGGALLFFIIFMIFDSKSFEKKALRSQQETFTKAFATQVTQEKYNESKRETTRKELEKLYQSDEFKKMQRSKGNNPESWNWQVKEKSKKVVYRDNNESCSEDDDLSQITLSDD